MKKIVTYLFVVLLVFSLVGCNQKSTDKDIITENEAKISNELITDIGYSDKFDKVEIENAIKIVKENFSFPASTLTKIYYDEEKSNFFIKSYLENGRGQKNKVKAEDIIVILTNFDVDDSGDNPVLNANSTYEDYNWILIREDNKSNWEIDDQGY
jgi:hypothetical protein